MSFLLSNMVQSNLTQIMGVKINLIKQGKIDKDEYTSYEVRFDGSRIAKLTAMRIVFPSGKVARNFMFESTIHEDFSFLADSEDELIEVAKPMLLNML